MDAFVFLYYNVHFTLPKKVHLTLPKMVHAKLLITTAFAPETTGIPYYKGENLSTLEIIKQLYDIGRLFDRVTK